MHQSYAPCREEQTGTRPRTARPVMHRTTGGLMKSISVKMAVSQLALAMTLFAGAANAETLTLYTSQPESDAATTVDAFKKAHPDVEVKIYRSGTSDILGKLAAEFSAGSPQPD